MELIWSREAFIFPMGAGLLRIYHATTRRNLISGIDIFKLIDKAFKGLSVHGLKEIYNDTSLELKFFDATQFNLNDHAYRNSSMFCEDFTEQSLEVWDFDVFIEHCIDCGFLVEQLNAQISTEKRSFGDRFRGNFYEQIATEALYNRTTPEEWWVKQKFGRSKDKIRNTPYKFIEQKFLSQYFEKEFPGKTVLEVGCGTGHFSSLIAKYAKKVVGLDFNTDYIKLAQRNNSGSDRKNLSFVEGDITNLNENGGGIGGEIFDAVILIDTFLFLFDDKYQNSLFQNRKQVVKNLRNLLSCDGRLIIMDPHIFWLTPWFGGEQQPFGIVSEYRNRSFKVIPTLEEMSLVFYEGGLTIRRIFEPIIDDEYQKYSQQDWAFMSEFPQWCLWELEATK